MSDLQSYLLQLNPVISRKNGAQLAKQIALPIGPGIAVPAATKQFVDKIRRGNIIGYCENNCSDANVSGIVAFRLLSLVSLVEGDLETAYRHESAAYDLVLDYVSGDNSAWIIPVLVRLSNDLRVLATMVGPFCLSSAADVTHETLLRLCRLTRKLATSTTSTFVNH